MVAAALALAFVAGMVVQAQRPGEAPATPVVLQAPAGVRSDVPPGQYEPFSTREEVAQFVVDGGAHHYCEAHSTAGDHYCTLQKIGDLGSPPVASQGP